MSTSRACKAGKASVGWLYDCIVVRQDSGVANETGVKIRHDQIEGLLDLARRDRDGALRLFEAVKATFDAIQPVSKSVQNTAPFPPAFGCGPAATLVRSDSLHVYLDARPADRALGRWQDFADDRGI